MATGVSGYLPSYYQYNAYYENLYGGMWIRPHYTEEYNVEGNYSIVKIDYIAFASSMYSYSVGWNVSGTINIAGTDYSYSGSVTTPGTSINWPCSIISNPIYHNNDGSKAITIALTYASTYSTQVGAQWSNTGTLSSAAVTLTTIPRASTATATDANIGAVSQITVTRKSASYTHSIRYAFGNLNGYIDSSGGIVSGEVKYTTTSIGFTVPTTFYDQIPNAKNGTCTLTITTYLNATQIGDAQTCAFTATAAEANCAPAVSGTVVDTNEATLALTGNENTLVRYYSNALCTISATAKNSASISKKTISGVEVTENTRTITGIETETVTFAVADSRGYSRAVDVTKSFVPYIKLTNNAQATRTDPTSGRVTLSLKGSCFTGSFGAVTNSISAKYSVDGGDYISASITVDGDSYTAEFVTVGFDYQNSHELEVVVTDALMSATKTIIVPKGVPVFDWDEDSFNFNVPITVNGVSLALALMPVGFIYTSSDPTSPAELFGGTWEAITDRVIVGAGGSYAVGGTGGAETHTLTQEHIPNYKIGFMPAAVPSGHGEWDNGGIRSGAQSPTGKTGTTGSGTGTLTTQWGWDIYTDGGNQPHNNMQPYIAKYIWERVE